MPVAAVAAFCGCMLGLGCAECAPRAWGEGGCGAGYIYIYIFFFFGTGVAMLVVVYKPKLLPLKKESVFQDSRKALMAR